MEVSYVPIFFAMSMISCLSIPTSGRKTSCSLMLSVKAMLSRVWLATWLRASRTSFIEELMQENNLRNVELFNNITEGLTGIIDKLYLLRQKSPDYYNEILKVGRPKQLYEIYNTLKMYLD